MKRVLVAFALALTATGPVGRLDDPVSAQSINPPGNFNKISPPIGSFYSSSVPWTWGTSAGATSYEYCADDSNNNRCDGSWTNVGNNTAVIALVIAYSDFWWQVRARNQLGTVEASGGWWRLRSTSTPRAFPKNGPANGATSLSTSVILGWLLSAGMTRYEYCIDTVLNNTCDGGWVSNGLGIGVIVNGLAPGTTHEWQIRAVNANGVTVADGGTWWRFTTRPLPPGTYFFDDFESYGGIGWREENDNNNNIWRVSDESAHSATEAWSDSFAGPYEPNLNVWIESPEFSLIGATHPVLSFWHQHDFAPDGFDRGNVYVRANGGTYSLLRDFYGSDLTWRQETFDLTPYAGAASVQVVFQLWSNSSQEGDGWYIDDVVVAEPTPAGGFSPPVITAQPQSQTAAAGQTATLDVTATGATPLTYQWYAGSSGDTSAPLAGQTGATFTTPRLGATTRYWVRVSNIDGSADSAVATVSVRFTDDPLVAGVTVVRTVHISELRVRIDALRTRFQLLPFAWTDTILTGTTRIRAQHIVDLRAALAEVYARAPLTPPSYTDSILTPGITAMKIVHVREIRAAVLAIE